MATAALSTPQPDYADAFLAPAAAPREFRQDNDLLDLARVAWDHLEDFRARRRRSRNYYRGRQWDETMTDPDTGLPISEREYIERQGRLPAVNQQVAPVVANLMGQLALNKSDPTPFPVDRDDADASKMMAAAVEGFARANRLERLEAEQFEELILSGGQAWRVCYDYLEAAGRDDVRVDRVPMDRLFFNSDVRDTRLDGLTLVGELHDMTIDAVVAAFAETEADGQALRALFAGEAGRNPWATQAASFSKTDSLSFHRAVDAGQCRVVEVWDQRHAWAYEVKNPETGQPERFGTLEEAEAFRMDVFGQKREAALAFGLDLVTADAVAMQALPEVAQHYRPTWHCTFLSGYGQVLYESESVYWHRGHPYAIGLAVRVDGETWGLVESLIDAQRMTNRISSAVDYIFGKGSKGSYLFNKNAVEGANTTVEEITGALAAGHDVGLDVPAGQKVEEMYSREDPVQIPGWLMQWMEMWTERIRQTSGVQSAALGAAPQSGTPAALYQLQLVQSSTNVRYIFDTHFETRRLATRKGMQVAAQFYDAPRQIRNASGAEPVQFDPAAVRGIDWDIAAADVTDTAVGWQLWEQKLMDFLQAQHITFAEYLQMSGDPQADKVLSIIAQRPALMGGIPGAQGVAEIEALAAAEAQGGPAAAEQLLQQMQAGGVPAAA